MPLFHNTWAFNFRTLSRANPAKLTPTDCPVFNERLLYFFYGRPAYRVLDEESDLLSYAPVCFLLKPDAVTSVERVFPFDTGAFHTNRFSPYVHAKMNKADFELGTDASSARKAITAFFGSTRDYYVGRLSRTLTPTFSQMELAAYIDLVKRPSATAVDDRRYSIEIQTSASISLVGNTLAVVLPYEAMDDSEICTFVIDRLGARPIPYITALGIRPSAFHTAILQVVYEFLDKGGYL